MDLHVIGPLASPAERAAVDGVLGPPESRLGRRAAGGRASTGTRPAAATRPRATLAAAARPARRPGPDRLDQPAGARTTSRKRLAVPPAEAYGVATFYALYATKPRPPVVAHVCDDIACRIAGAEGICDDLRRTLGEAGEPSRDGRVDLVAFAVSRSVRPRPGGDGHRMPVRRPGSRVLPRRMPPLSWRDSKAASATTRPTTTTRQAGTAGLRLLRRVGVVDPSSLDDYRAHGGYAGLSRAIEIGADAVIAEVTASKLDGPRRRRLPDGPQVGGGRRPARPAALRRLQRGRVGARHVQGPGAPGGRPVRGHRGDDDRRVRDGRDRSATCTSAASTRRPRLRIRGAIDAARGGRSPRR